MKKDKSFSLTSLTRLSSGILQEQAAAYLASGSYKITQEIYKILLKREDIPRYRQGLAKCYLQRSLIAAEKGKYKEAITFWENHSEYDDSHAENAQYVGWLLKAGQKQKIKTYLQSLEAASLDKDYPKLALNLGFLHICGQIDLFQWLPEDSAFALQTEQAQHALAAFQQNDRPLMQQRLAKIPFRSPYRDFCTLLKSAAMLFESPVQANDLLSRLSTNSPYHSAGRLIAVLSLTGKELTDALLTLPHKQQQIICKAKDWTDQQIKLLQFLSRQKKQLSDKMKFDLAIQYQKLLGADYARRFCMALLPAYPAGTRAYEKNFGALDTFEKLRISALNAEARQEYFDAVDQWDQCLELLYDDKQGNALKIALILRRMAQLCDPSEGIAYSIESLEFDAGDRETHLKIIHHYEHVGEKAKYKKRLEESLAMFPEDVEFLGLAMQAAIRNDTFKKAAQYAAKILAIDPVNTRAKRVLFSSHLNHARKLLVAKKFHLVEKEINSAEKLKPGKHFPSLVQMLYGFFVYVSEDKIKGGELIEKSRKSSPEGDFVSRFRVINETLRLNIPLAPILRAISPLQENHVLSEAELNSFIHLLEEQQKEGNPVLVKTLEKTKKDLKCVIKEQTFNQEQLLSLMLQLDKLKQFELMRHCLKCIPDSKSKPVWIFYKTYLEASGNPAKVTPFGITKLQFQYTLAKEQGEQRAATLISNFLDKIYYFQNQDFPSANEDGEPDPYEKLFDHIDSRTFTKINRKFDQLYENSTEDELIMEIVKMLPDKNMITLLLKDPECINAMLFLNAARELGIDIQVTVEDLLETAQEDSPASYPFPFK